MFLIPPAVFSFPLLILSLSRQLAGDKRISSCAGEFLNRMISCDGWGGRKVPKFHTGEAVGACLSMKAATEHNFEATAALAKEDKDTELFLMVNSAFTPEFHNPKEQHAAPLYVGAPVRFVRTYTLDAKAAAATVDDEVDSEEEVFGESRKRKATTAGAASKLPRVDIVVPCGTIGVVASVTGKFSSTKVDGITYQVVKPNSRSTVTVNVPGQTKPLLITGSALKKGAGIIETVTARTWPIEAATWLPVTKYRGRTVERLHAKLGGVTSRDDIYTVISATKRCVLLGKGGSRPRCLPSHSQSFMCRSFRDISVEGVTTEVVDASTW